MNKLTKKKGKNKVPKKFIDYDYMDVTQCAKFLKITTSHLYKLTSNRKIPHIKFLGKKLLFDKQRVNEWLQSKAVSVKKR